MQESLRVFPLSDWTEVDVWRYIDAERLDVLPLYFAAERPVGERKGALIMVNNERMRLLPGKQPALRTIRFRTLGCWPLSDAVRSNALNPGDIVRELMLR